jgi:tRNA-splicing ligase RtcB (3'-phosphate/5'-hydroxy nucleic acid ligase)
LSLDEKKQGAWLEGKIMNLIPIDNVRFEIAMEGNMRVPGRIYISEKMLSYSDIKEPLQQVMNVAMLPGIVHASLAMPDMHWGYGFPIGGVAAFDWEKGVVSPGGVGYDINCGVRLATTEIEAAFIRPRLQELVDNLYRHIPCGVGSTGSIKLSKSDEKRVLLDGAKWAVSNGMGEEMDLLHTEDGGCIASADPNLLSDRAISRGRDQLGTLGSGNHFLEVGVVETIFDETAAAIFGLFEGQVTVMLHSGSRGLGYQVCDDFLAEMHRSRIDLGFELPDRQLVCAPIGSEVGGRYLRAMACAANYAWANRQILLHRTREVFMRTLGMSPNALSMNLVYDVCHNIAKKEHHRISGEERVVCVHRKGATRSFGPGHPDICEDYRSIGQPTLIPGDMGRASYVMVGTEVAMAETFGSACHGAGRRLSRKAALKASRGRSIYRELEDKGILVRWTGKSTLAEEMPDAYKDVEEVVDVVHKAGIARRVARLRPMAVVKG